MNITNYIGQEHHQKKTFVFDLHDVLFKRNYWLTLVMIYSIKNKLKLFFILLNPFCLYDVFKTLSVTRVSEAYLIKLCQRHAALLPYLETIIDITNAICPIQNMFSLIEQLKSNGNKLYIFSNIGKRTFEKLAHNNSHLFTLFDGIHYVEEHNGWLAKPNHNAYKEFLKKFNIDPKTMVFIDDKNKNIKAAHALGITAFVYKSAHQIMHTFQKMGCL